MALTGTGSALGTLIQGNIDALSDADKSDRDKLFAAMGDAIITHLTGAAGVGAVTVPGAFAGGPGLPGNLI